MLQFQDTFSKTRESWFKYTPHLDPDLVRRAHSNSDVPPFDLPKIVHVPSHGSSEDIPDRVSIHGTSKSVKHGIVELHPGDSSVFMEGDMHKEALKKVSRILQNVHTTTRSFNWIAKPRLCTALSAIP